MDINTLEVIKPLTREKLAVADIHTHAVHIKHSVRVLIDLIANDGRRDFSGQSKLQKDYDRNIYGGGGDVPCKGCVLIVSYQSEWDYAPNFESCLR